MNVPEAVQLDNMIKEKIPELSPRTFVERLCIGSGFNVSTFVVNSKGKRRADAWFDEDLWFSDLEQIAEDMVELIRSDT